MLVGVLLLLVMASIAWVHSITTAEAEPSVRLGVVTTAAAVRELCARDEAEGFALSARCGGRGGCSASDAEEAYRRDVNG